MNKKRIAIIGATGFTGSELVRILFGHPDVEIVAITSESRAGEPFSAVHPFFRGIVDQKLESVENIKRYNPDLVFLALPHGVSMEYVKKFEQDRFKIVDLSGDFRLASPGIYEQWYKMDHSYPEGFKGAVYGLPELHPESIRKAKLVANPGCFPTSAILAAAPLFKSGLVAQNKAIFDSKTGVTGAGVKAKPVNHFSSVNDNFKAYGIKTHRHSIEIQEQLALLAGRENLIQFTPHLLPVDRGILTTVYAEAEREISRKKLREIYQDFYHNAPFVRLCDTPPAIKDVRATNFCDIYVDYDARTNNIIVISVIDNLMKGAASQAVQNMNLMFDLNEKTGLGQIAVSP